MLYISVFCCCFLLALGGYAFYVRNPLSDVFAFNSAGEAREKRGFIEWLADLMGSLFSVLPAAIKNLISLPDLPEVLKIVGWRFSSEEFLGIRVLSSVTFAILFALPFGRAWWIGVIIGAFIGYILPVSILAQRINSIGFNLQRATPLFLDLLVVGIRGGQSIEDALVWAAKIDDDLHGEIQRVVNDIKGSMTIQEALGELARRAEIMDAGELAGACEIMGLAHRYGAGGISVALENVVRDMDARRGYLINSRIKKMENVVTVPLVLSPMIAALVSMALPYLFMMYGGANGALFKVLN